MMSRFDQKTTACPDADQSGAYKRTVEFTGKEIDKGTWCKIDGINYVVEVFGLDYQGNSVPLTEHHDTHPLMIKLLERT